MMSIREDEDLEPIDALIDRCSFCESEEYRTIYKTKNFQVRLSLGQITEGYCLILPNEHYGCMGALPESLRGEYLALKSKVRHVLEQAYGACIFYEHGRAGTCDVQPGEQLCYHAHIHGVPINGDMLSGLKELFVPLRLSDYSELFDIYPRLGQYLYYEDRGGQAYVIAINRSIRRQYLRHLAAELVGHPERASWRDFPGWPEIHRAKERLSPYFETSTEEE